MIEFCIIYSFQFIERRYREEMARGKLAFRCINPLIFQQRFLIVVSVLSFHIIFPIVFLYSSRYSVLFFHIISCFGEFRAILSADNGCHYESSSIFCSQKKVRWYWFPWISLFFSAHVVGRIIFKCYHITICPIDLVFCSLLFGRQNEDTLCVVLIIMFHQPHNLRNKKWQN